MSTTTIQTNGNVRITHFNRETAQAMRQLLDAQLSDLADVLGISIKTGKIRYGGNVCTVAMECATKGDGGQINSLEAENFKGFARSYGFEPSDLHREFISRGQRYKIVGLKPRAGRFPIIGERGDGKRFKFTPEIKYGFLGAPHLKATIPPDVMPHFRMLVGQLSPENLHCDGEISRTAAARKERELRKQWAALEKQVGRKVTEDEVWAVPLPLR